MTLKNHFYMKFTSLSENVGIARITAAAFAAQVDLTLNEIEEIKVAISEAVSNCVIHGYAKETGIIELSMDLSDGQLVYKIVDYGIGIADIELAKQPSYSTDPERMGLGFVFMESFMDKLLIESNPGQGTTVTLIKKIEPASSH